MSPSPAAGRVERLVWDDEMIARFWDYYSTRPQTYFSTAFGEVIARRSVRWMPAGGRVLDYGCGAGGLVQALLARGLHVGAVDHSPMSLQAVRRQCEAAGGLFLGAWQPDEIAAAPAAAGSFDAVFLIEVIEHLSDNHLAKTLAAARRLLRPGGHLICTTPNEEDIEAALVFCPASGKVFHPTQHVRSWTAAGLADTLRRAGFAEVVTQTTDFGADFRCFPRRWAVRAAKISLRFPYKDPHLMAVARV